MSRLAKRSPAAAAVARAPRQGHCAAKHAKKIPTPHGQSSEGGRKLPHRDAMRTPSLHRGLAFRNATMASGMVCRPCRSSVTEKTEVLAHCNNCLLVWNGVLFWNGVVTFFLLLAIICCGKIRPYGQGSTRFACVTLACICTAILAALSYATRPLYMLVAIVVGGCANAVLLWALRRVIPSLDPKPGIPHHRLRPDRGPKACQARRLRTPGCAARSSRKRIAAFSGARRARLMIAR